ncbi:MAG: serine/threonine-protein kinase [Kofleriaceae bacterium]
MSEASLEDGAVSDEPVDEPVDPFVATQMQTARPVLDDYVRDVMKAQVAAALFGAAAVVKVGRYELRREVGTGGGGSVFVAWDPELAREVALKLIVAGSERLRARALAEGQALAKLSHPNIVPVFDVGVIDERVYLVMELIRGESLRSFAASHRPKEIIAAYRQCGEGLAAAHAAKLVHRDFKPDNAVVGADGRVRVIDFGLAIEDLRELAPALQGGTPRYMSPEQQRGEPLTAATDQYAFAVSLREALAPTPAWLEGLLARARADRPDDRFPSMTALNAALARDPATVWRRRALVAVPLALGAAGYLAGYARDAEPPRCDGGPEALRSAWSPARQQAVVAHVAGLATPYTTVAAPQLGAGLEAYAGRWLTAYRDGCVAHQRGELSAPAYDRRQSCLGGARTQFATLVGLAEQTPASKVEAIVRALPELADPASCADLEALSTVAPPSLAQAAGAAQLGERLDRARVLVASGADDVEGELAALVREARALGYRPLLAAALLAQGTAFVQRWKASPAEAPLAEANQEALRSRDYASAVEAFARLAWARARRRDQPLEAALEGLTQIEALAEGLPANGRFAQALLYNNLGSIQIAATHPEQARGHFQRSIELARGVTGPGAIELSAALQGLALVTDDQRRRSALLAQRAELLHGRLGDEHPMTLTTKITAALTQLDPAEARLGLRPSCLSLAQLHPSRGDTIAECALELAWLELTVDPAGLRAPNAAARTALQISRAATADDPFYASTAAAHLRLLDGDPAGAAAQFAELIAARPRSPAAQWPEHFELGQLELGLGLAHLAAERAAPAAAAFARARVQLEAATSVYAWPPALRRLAWLKEAR